MKKIYPSSSAFQWGDLTVTQYSSGCLRSIFLASQGVREQISGDHQSRGKLNEDLYEETLKQRGIQYDREKPFRVAISSYHDTFVSGRIDFIEHLPDGPIVSELKSTESANVRRDVIDRGKVKVNNLAQVVSYMVAERIGRANLIYTFYKHDKKSPKVLKKSSERCFVIAVDVSGVVTIDSVESAYTVHDLLSHQQAAAKHVNECTIAPRPFNWSSFDGPCKRCPFASVCERYDANEIKTVQDFIFQAFKLVTNTEGNK